MLYGSATVDRAFRIADVDPRLFGSFVEHMGRCVYNGIYEPEHPLADSEGFRTDVAEHVRALGVPLLRYPGGNFVSGYDWEDGVGAREQRPRRRDLAWRSIETNQVGPDEFIPWAQSVGAATMMAVNLGTRGIDAARSLLEYCNLPGGTKWSDLRQANGRRDPYGVKVWCLGNEMDGPWQVGHKTAEEYARSATETAKVMRLVDPTIELVACGSSNSRMPTFGSWERAVLTETYEHVDYISMHSYYEERAGDRDSFLACAVDMDQFIDAVVATCDHVRAVGRHRKRLHIAFDEWNVWYLGRFAGERQLEWAEAPPLIEDTYNVVDAVVVGNLLISLLRHADRVKIANLAQLVNVIAPIRTEVNGSSWRQTIFYPFALTSRYGRGTVLRVELQSPRHDTPWFADVNLLDAVAVLEHERDAVTVFAVNRHQREPIQLNLDLRGCPGLFQGEHICLFDQDPEAVNDARQPERVVPRRLDELTISDGRTQALLPPLSWSMLRMKGDR